MLNRYTPSLSPADHLIVQLDRAIRTLTPGSHTADRPSPAAAFEEQVLDDTARHHAAGLMRVNHTGEVCAQALYQGQALTAKLPRVRGEMARAADEEVEHLAWCEERLQQLGSHTSVLNPLWYALSFGLGAGAGVIGDKVSLGFVAATEDQVCEHLGDHLRDLPVEDVKSRALVAAMMEDEQAHGKAALRAGGLAFPNSVKRAMRAVSRLMTTLSYRV